jgi:hypothetical protein
MNNNDAALDHSIAQNDVNSLYFSQKNVDVLQQGIRYSIYNKTDKVIHTQSERELMVIMRSLYLQYSKNLPSNIVAQVKELNARVLDYIVPKLIVEMAQYKTYIHDASTLPVPMSRGLNTSTTGTKFLHVKEF